MEKIEGEKGLWKSLDSCVIVLTEYWCCRLKKLRKTNDPISVGVVSVCPAFLVDLGYVNGPEVEIEHIEKRGVYV